MAWRDSVLLTFEPLSSSYSASRDAHKYQGRVLNEGTSHIGFKVKLSSRERVEVKGEPRGLEDLDGGVSVHVGAMDGDAELCGRFVYFPAQADAEFGEWPANYAAEVVVTSQQFNELLHCTSQGILPRSITLRVTGLKYGWEPDGSGKVWEKPENGAQRSEGVREVSFVFTLGSVPREPGDSWEEQPQVLPPTAAHLEALSAQFAKSISEISARVNKRLSHLFWLLALVAILLVFRR